MKKRMIRSVIAAICAACFCSNQSMLADDLPIEKANALPKDHDFNDTDAEIGRLESMLSHRDLMSLRLGIYVMIQEYRLEKQTYMRKYSAEEQRMVTRGILGAKRYQAVEAICLNAIESGENAIKYEGMHILSQLLASDALEDKFQAIVDADIARLRGDQKPQNGIIDLFNMSEYLAFVGNKSGVYIIESALYLDDIPVSYMRRAMRALQFLSIALPSDMMRDLLLSSESIVAYDAFKWMGGDSYSNNMVRAAAITQLQRTSASADLELSGSQRILVMTVSSTILSALREDLVSGEELAIIRPAVMRMIKSGIPETQYCVGSLFAHIATDAEIGLIDTLLASNSQDAVEIGLLALARCSPSLIKERKELLVKNLENDAQLVRFFSLCALKYGIGEISGNLFTEEEFQTQKKHVLDVLSRENK